MLTERLIKEIGLLKLQVKSTPNSSNNQITTQDVKQNQLPAEPASQNSMEVVKLDKSEFRLLVNMLQAIGHECTYDHISCDGHIVTYQHPKKTLIFNDITLTDTEQTVNLSSLSDIIANNHLKRPVWEKLKTI